MCKEVASKKKTNSRLECKNRYPIYHHNDGGKMAIIDTLFMNQNGWKTIPFWSAHTYIAHIREYPSPSRAATIPYIKGTSETIARILQPYNIRVAHRLRYGIYWLTLKTRTNLTTGKERFTRSSAPAAKPPTSPGETGRNLKTRLTEHRRVRRNGDVNNHIAEHHRLTNHTIDWDSAQCVTYSINYFQRLTLESWFTNLEQTSLNKCQQLQAPYKRLIHDMTTRITITNEPNRTT